MYISRCIDNLKRTR